MGRFVRVSFCLAAALALVVSACGGGKPVKVGVILPLSGDFALYGDPIRKGIELAFEHIQEDAEYPHELELDVRDSQSDPQRARQLLEELFDENVPAVIGGVTTDEALAMVQLADEKGRVLISPSASSPQLTGISSNFFRVFPSDFLEGTKMGTFADQGIDIDQVVIVAAESAFAKGLQQVFRSEFERSGGEVLEVIEYPPNTAELDGVVERMVTLNPQAVYLADYANGLVTLIKSLRERGYEGRILTTAAFATPEALAESGDAAEGVVLTQSIFEAGSQEPHIQRFVESYREKYGTEPGLYAAHGYDAMQVYAFALSEGGKLPRDFWRGMRSVANFTGVTGVIQFDEKGDVQKFPRVYVVRDGELVDYEKVLRERREELENRRKELEDQFRNLQRRQKALRGQGG